jgi:Spy/CpxP family protein refolding chaperone
MKALTYFTALALTGLLTASALAQADDKKPAEPTTPKKDASGKADRRAAMQDRFAKVSEELKLTDEQKEKLKPIFKDEAEKKMSIRTSAGSDRKGAFQKLRDLQQEVDGKVKPVLTEEQKVKWDKIKDEGLPARKKNK